MTLLNHGIGSILREITIILQSCESCSIFAPVPEVQYHIGQEVNAPLDRFLGQQVRLQERERLGINEHIHSECLEVLFIDNSLPEEQARLYLFPIADGTYSMHLLYLQHTDLPFTGKVTWLHFQPDFWEQFPIQQLQVNTPFRFDQTTEQQFQICNQSLNLITQLQQAHPLTDLLQSLQRTEMVLHLLRRALENITVPFTACPVPACRFLAYDSEREKIADAKRILEQGFDQSITIKELSRKVAMNECYLKKGFKALVGKTIHEYQQELRISKAKELLTQPGYSVSAVASLLGYSSISHFSTSFKKATGLKPCELLG